MIYVNTRIISSNILLSLFALLVFASQGLVFQYSGVTYTEYAVMTLLTLGTTIYLVYHRVTSNRRILLAILGLLFYFIIRTKESGIIFGVLFFGLGFNDEDIFSWLCLAEKLRWVFFGFIVGILFMMSLDQIILGDALFSLRPANLKILLSFNAVGDYDVPSNARKAYNWYQFFGRNLDFLAPFILYMIGLGGFRDKRFRTSDKMVWLLPLALLLFLTITKIFFRWGVYKRYVIPVLPIVSILSVRCLRVNLQDLTRSYIKILDRKSTRLNSSH